MTSQLRTNHEFSVAVIIPTYNRVTTLSRALDSVLKQSLPPAQIIVIDDGSTDATAELIHQNYPTIHYHFQVNQGISKARNTGISLAKRNWIAFLDSDDEWLPKKLENQINALRQNPAYKLCHSNEIWIRKGRRVNPKLRHQKSGGYIFHRCLSLCVISPSSVLVHQSVFSRFGQFDESLPVCEDYDMWLRICAFLPVLYLEEPQIIKYGGHSDQLSTKHWGIDRFRIRALEKTIQDPDLKSEYQTAAVRMLIHKISIYLKGAEKRGKSSEVEKYSQLLEKYRRKFTVSDPGSSPG